MSHRRIRFSYANIAATVALFLAVSGGVAVAVGTIPGGDGTIHGCYGNATGQLRVVPSGEECRSNETALPWSQRGPKGDAGDPAPADGGGVVFGRVLTNGTRCLLGYPSGIAASGTGDCSLAGATSAASMPVPSDKRMRSLRARIDEPQPHDTTFWLVTPTGVVGSCTIVAGGTACARPGSGPLVPAGTPLSSMVTYSNDPAASAPSVSFSYELTSE